MYRVVLADDESGFREWFRRLLEGSEDFQVVGEARTGTEALRLVEHLRPDLVIADLYMPDGDGLEVARSVHGLWVGVEVVLVRKFS